MFDTREDVAARLWDSERRSSPYSTVADPYTDDDYCEACDSTVDYSDGSTHGRCRCES
jgi:hypothetical protein